MSLISSEEERGGALRLVGEVGEGGVVWSWGSSVLGAWSTSPFVVGAGSGVVAASPFACLRWRASKRTMIRSVMGVWSREVSRVT